MMTWAKETDTPTPGISPGLRLLLLKLMLGYIVLGLLAAFACRAEQRADVRASTDWTITEECIDLETGCHRQDELDAIFGSQDYDGIDVGGQ